MNEHKEFSPRRIFLILAGSIYGIELLIMVAFLILPPLPPIWETVVDSTALTLLAAPVIYRFAVSPLYRYLWKNQDLSSQLEELNKDLEQRVQDRTEALRVQSIELAQQTRQFEKTNLQLHTRTAQFEVLAEVTHAITSVRNLQELLPFIASVISEKFAYYHVGIFMVDQASEYAALSATNSEGGRKMMERGHRLRIGEQGIVGNVVATGRPRIVMDVGKDAVFFDNLELAETHSELAVPLTSGNRVIGALDVQSTKLEAFLEEDVQLLSLLANQVSLAIENARLFEETRRALSEAESVSRQSTREAWTKLPAEQNLVGYRYSQTGVVPLDKPVEPVNGTKANRNAKKPESNSVVVPIELRGETIGTLVIQSPSSNVMNQDQLDLIRAVAERVAISAENARLFDETTRRAERERLVSDITGKIRSVNDPQSMIQTAMEELRKALGASRVEIVPQTVKDAESGIQ